MRSKTGRLTEALTGRLTDHHALFLLIQMLHRIDAITADIATVLDRIDAQIAPFAQAGAWLDEIHGVEVTAARAIIAEVGLDMSRFPTPAHLASWAGLPPA
jgi:transposase